MNKSEDGLEVGRSFEEARVQLEETFFPPSRPPGGKRISCIEDSVESSGMELSKWGGLTLTLKPTPDTTLGKSLVIKDQKRKKIIFNFTGALDFWDFCWKALVIGQLTSSDFIINHRAGFNKIIVPQYPPSYLQEIL